MPATTPSTRWRRLGMIGAAEAQRVEAGDRPRAHGEDVAQDAADARRRALVGLDERRVVVRLHLEDDREAVADVDDAGVLARALDDARARGRQVAQVDARRLVRAVLAPHHARRRRARCRSASRPRIVVDARGTRRRRGRAPWRAASSMTGVFLGHTRSSHLGEQRREQQACRRPSRAAPRRRARGAASGRPRCRAALQMPAMLAHRAVGVGGRRSRRRPAST